MDCLLPAGTVESVKFSPDGLFIAFGSMDKSVSFIDIRQGKIIKKFKDIHNSSITKLLSLVNLRHCCYTNVQPKWIVSYHRIRR